MAELELGAVLEETSALTATLDAVVQGSSGPHTHVISDVTGLTAALAGKAAAVHTHDDRYYTETETDTLLAGKADAVHTHAQSDVTGLTDALASKIGEPENEGTDGQVLTTDGAGGRSWSTVQGGVTSVNGETGAVVLDADDVGALKSSDSAAGSANVVNADQLGGHAASYFQQALGGTVETWTFTLSDDTVVTKKVLILP